MLSKGFEIEVYTGTLMATSWDCPIELWRIWKVSFVNPTVEMWVHHSPATVTNVTPGFTQPHYPAGTI
jgi:hypothetical protein